jgi:hypothetical protein
LNRTSLVMTNYQDLEREKPGFEEKIKMGVEAQH